MKMPLPTVSGLDAIMIPSPCPVSWGNMQGDARVRFCSQCEQNVYNLSEMTAAQAMALIKRHSGQICVQLFRRPDGTVLTADSPVGWRLRIWKRWRRHLAWAASLFALAFLPGCPAGGNLRMPDHVYIPEPDRPRAPAGASRPNEAAPPPPTAPAKTAATAQ